MFSIDNRQSSIVNPEVRIFAGLEPLSWAAATHFEQLARVKALEKKPFSVALSGGSTPKPLYELLASPTFAGRVRWSNVHLFQVDERCVPPDDPQSNYRMIRQALLDSAPLPGENFHRMAAERPDREQAAHDYAEELARVLHPAPNEWPRLDLVFLGMGSDGHTASLFPGSQALEERTAWVAPNFAARLNSFRLTLTLPVLNAAAHVIFLVAGADKAETVRQVLEGPQGRFPAQLVQPVRGRLSWFLDESAAQLLSAGTRR
ncbi:MAG: 6-phosphogluconolactonase [Terriglobia bacterium]